MMARNNKNTTKLFLRLPFLFWAMNLVPSSNATMRRAPTDEDQRQLQVTPQPTVSMVPSTMAPSAAPSPAPSPIAPPTTDGPPDQEPTDEVGIFDFIFEIIYGLLSYLFGLDKRGSNRPPGYVAPTGIFRLKIHWQDDYVWQNDPRERRYCMACTRCDQFNFANNGADDSPFNCRTGDCEAGDQLWSGRCDDGFGDNFEVLDLGLEDGIHVRAVTGGNNVCFTRAETRFLSLEPCDPDNQRQKFQFFTIDQPFELKPMYLPFYYFPTEGSYCITQPHHPKSQELFGIKDCAAEDDIDTRLWNAIDLIGGGPSNPSNPNPSPSPPTDPNPSPSPPTDPNPSPSPPTDPGPTPTNPSDTLDLVGDDGSPTSAYPLAKCQGDCDDNEDCQDGLVCFQRRDDSDQVPGCNGEPNTEFNTPDYCTSPDDIPAGIRADSDLWNVALPGDW